MMLLSAFEVRLIRRPFSVTPDPMSRDASEETYIETSALPLAPKPPEVTRPSALRSTSTLVARLMLSASRVAPEPTETSVTQCAKTRDSTSDTSTNPPEPDDAFAERLPSVGLSEGRWVLIAW